MKAAEQSWKENSPAVVRVVRPRRNGTRRAAMVGPTSGQPLELLTEKIFFPAGLPPRRRVLFLGTDRETEVSGICERLAQTVARLTGNLIGIACEMLEALPPSPGKKQPRLLQGEEAWRNSCTPLSESVWRIPASIFRDPRTAEASVLAAEIDSHFAHLLFAAKATGSHAFVPRISCDGVVLVLTADRTRRQVALRAMEELAGCRVPILGTILDKRQFPVPSAIYHAL